MLTRRNRIYKAKHVHVSTSAQLDGGGGGTKNPKCGQKDVYKDMYKRFEDSFTRFFMNEWDITDVLHFLAWKTIVM